MIRWWSARAARACMGSETYPDSTRILLLAGCALLGWLTGWLHLLSRRLSPPLGA